jgi:hypothetical protein
LNGAIYPLTYDVVQDFEPVGLISTNPFLILAKEPLNKPSNMAH